MKDDVKRRDFTINSLYLDSKGNLTDFLKGENDIISRKLIFIGNPAERIEEDYLRIIRFCRFSGNFDNKMSKNIIKEIISKVPKIIYLSNKRIRDEINKILLTKNCYKCFFMMTKLTLDKYLLINKNNYRRSEISTGFVIKNFGKYFLCCSVSELPIMMILPRYCKLSSSNTTRIFLLALSDIQ